MAPNPTPVKAALAEMGLINDFVRQPLVRLTEEEKSELINTIKSCRANLMALL